MNILVLCTGNSARSILLEYILKTRSNGAVKSFSAGSKPAGRVHPQSLRLLAAKGIDASGARSKSWDEFALEDAPIMDAVITVCGSAAEEECPIWPAGPHGAPIRAHWGVEDPAAAEEADWDSAFSEAYAILGRRADAFLAHDLANLQGDALRAALKDAGRVA